MKVINNKHIGSSINIAKHIAYLCQKQNYEYNNTKIQKLLYICYGYFLVFIHDKFLTDEQPKAWPFGAVFPRVFNYIKTEQKNYAEKFLGLKDDESELLDCIIKDFGSFAAGKLAAWSHRQGTPWDRIIKQEGENWNIVIPNEFIKEYFEINMIKRGAK